MENRLTTGASIPIFSEFQRGCRPARTNSVQIPKTTDVEFAQWQVNRYSFPYRSRGNFWLTVPSRISGETGQNEKEWLSGKWRADRRAGSAAVSSGFLKVSESACILVVRSRKSSGVKNC
jgi:hypothetical protein